MVDRTYLSLSVIWNECQNAYKPEAMFIEKVADFLLSKSDWLEKPSGQNELLEVIKRRVGKKLEEKNQNEKKTSQTKKVTKEKKLKTKPVKPKKVENQEPGSKEILDLTNLEPDNSNQDAEEGGDSEKEEGLIPVNNGSKTERYV